MKGRNKGDARGAIDDINARKNHKTNRETKRNSKTRTQKYVNEVHKLY